MNTNDTTDLTRASVSQRLASLPRFRTSAIFLVVLVVLLVGPSIAISQTIPTISINSVVTDQTVSLTTYNYPANQDFVVTMGPMGSLGINGYYVKTVNSGAGRIIQCQRSTHPTTVIWFLSNRHSPAKCSRILQL